MVSDGCISCALCLASFFFFSFCSQGVGAISPPALYVFGDSYADTGNHDKQNPKVWQPWKSPYGYTWPGNPSGRYSDGFVLTDFIAKFLNLPSPMPSSQVKEMPDTGVNFAYGGSGLFYTYGPEYITISEQIDQFEQLAKGKSIDYDNSLVLFVYGGNDYSVQLQKNGVRSIPFFISRVVRQISVQLRRLHKLGFRRFAVTNLEPAGCLPSIRMPQNIMNCSRTDNALSSLHNRLLSQSLVTLRTFRGRNSKYILLDQYKSFLQIFSSGADYGFGEGLLQSCCIGIMKGAVCGSVDEHGFPMYKVCNDSSRAFFWDGVHPTQAGSCIA
ncbi:hypothetical protein KP509_36G042200 [Ceratopteris richardii]|uniref:GDSL esterase/lipase n=1 Tax=Ceratopteris richardii TaxID=49495 RepID=A0A8T2QCK9_CERRI|nr:hypothetical protein KP509_36G042200 [Ceratopteris richardii]